VTHHVTEDNKRTVETAAGLGLPVEMIATLLGLNPRTVTKRYAKQIAQGKAKSSMAISQTLFHKAVRQGDPTCLIWWTKTQMGWKEHRDPLTVQTAPGRPLEMAPVSREELTAQILQEIDAAKPAEKLVLPALEHEPVKAQESKLNGSHNKPNGANGHG
jgi:hypothetical protein